MHRCEPKFAIVSLKKERENSLAIVPMGLTAVLLTEIFRSFSDMIWVHQELFYQLSYIHVVQKLKYVFFVVQHEIKMEYSMDFEWQILNSYPGHSVCQCRLVDVGITSFRISGKFSKELYMCITCFLSTVYFYILISRYNYQAALRRYINVLRLLFIHFLLILKKQVTGL